MTWGEFKAKVEAGGIDDDSELSYIDWCGIAGDPDSETPHVGVHISKNDGIAWITDT